MDNTRLTNLTDTLVEYVLSEMKTFSDMDYSQQQKIKSLKITILEKGINRYEISVGMGIAEAFFDLNGTKKSGSLGGSIERFVTHWLARPLNQDAIKSLLEK